MSEQVVASQRSVARLWVLPLLCGAATLSGAAALVFETLWFRQAGLVLGNAVWSSSIVLAAFMAGLGAGNALAGRLARRLARPLLAYATLELFVGVSGAALVAALPALPPLLAPLLRQALPHPIVLNGVRALVALTLLAVPTTAMGLTLPVLVRAAERRDRRFASTLGLLYGWNTTGAVAGCLLSELALIGWAGIRGSGLLAAGLNASAAALALALHWLGPPQEAAPAEAAVDSPRRIPWASLGAAFLAGTLMLALEVVWFRLLLLTIVGTSRAFAVMLATVLAGIALGGLLAARLGRLGFEPRLAAPLAGFAAGAATAFGYALYPEALARWGAAATGSITAMAGLAAALMLPSCLLSGLLFPLLGEEVRAAGRDGAQATGLLTLANTVGAMAGAIVGGYLLLPGLGVEAALYLLATGYAAVGVCALSACRREAAGRHGVLFGLAAAALLAVALLRFPSGQMNRVFLPAMIGRWEDLSRPGVGVASLRQGLTDTAVCVRTSAWGRPVQYKLLVNAVSMSAVGSAASRYMKEFVYLPLALQPRARSALLISYGVGVTAKALTDTSGLERIDVVDISRNVIEVTRAVYPEPGTHPLDDPRVRLHVEDGRFFLLASARSWDLITAEPPPPNNAGVDSLYSREYFALLRSRLAPRGVASYWLPLHQLLWKDGMAIVSAFCSAFPDCSLWSGVGPQCILLGTRGVPPVDEDGFARQWRDERARPGLAEMGFERPEDLGVTFLAGAEQLAAWASEVPPLEDDHPFRLTPRVFSTLPDVQARLGDWSEARARFESSGFVRRTFPERLRASTLGWFERTAPLTRYLWAGGGETGLLELRALLEGSSARTAVLWLMGSDVAHERAARAASAAGRLDPDLLVTLGIAAMADRDYRAAATLFGRARDATEPSGRLAAWRTLALCLAGDRREATQEALSADASHALVPDPEGWRATRERCGIPVR